MLLKFKAFTLAELLIALAVLGVIATFTIPKIMTAQADQQKKAVMKELFSTISSLVWNGYQAGEISYDGTRWNDGTYLRDHLNYVKYCASPAHGNGCWPQDDSISTGEAAENGFLLHNGASIAGISDTPMDQQVIIDWNGPSAPNVAGEDQFFASYNMSTNSRRAVLICSNSTTTACQKLFQERARIVGIKVFILCLFV